MKARLLGAISLSSGSRTALITSPGFAKAFAANFAATSALLALAASVPVVRSGALRLIHASQLAMLSAAHRYAWWGAISLLSSSCCALQLLLNLASVGCAGFNKVLGPLRPFLLSVTATLQLSMWYVALTQQPWQVPYALGASALTASLTFLPEALDALNRARASRFAAGGAPGARERAGGDAASVGGCFEVELALPSIGCTACVSKITQVLSGHPLCAHIAEIDVSVERAAARLVILAVPGGAPVAAGTAAVSSAGGSAARAAEIVGSLTSALEKGGFACAGAPQIRPLRATAAQPSAALRLRGGASATPAPACTRWWEHCGGLLGGLLASSCCALQLGLNAASASLGLGLGCAGFNTALGPWRPHLRALTAAWLSFLWAPALRARRRPSRPLLLSTLLSAGLALLPELLRLSGGPSLAPPTSSVSTLSLRIDGMGCEACERAVRQALASASGVVDTRARFESGVAELSVARDWGFDLGEVRQKLAAAGFDLLPETQPPAEGGGEAGGARLAAGSGAGATCALAGGGA